MRKVLEQVNMPLAGVALGVAALGNIPGLNLPPLRLLCAAIAAALLMLLLAKTLLLPRAMRQALQDPVAASVAPTAAMALMLLAAYMQPLSAVAAVGMWWCGVALHLALMLSYTQLLWLSWLLYIPALVNAFICLRGPFYPSFAALTFPFVISATATLRAVWMAGLPLIFYRIGQLQAGIAVIFVSYVLLRSLWALKPQ